MMTGGQYEKQAIVTLTSLNDTFPEKYLVIKHGIACKIGRKVSSKTQPDSGNGYFDAKVLSRTHGEITMDKNAVWIQDLQSSNGTFINGDRLSEEGKLSGLHQLRSGDVLDFGVDIKDDEGKVLYTKVSAKVVIQFDSASQSGTATKATTSSSSNVPAKPQDADDILAMLQSEKTLSLEAADALEKIKTTFELMDKNVTTMKKKPEGLANTDASMLTKAIAEINGRLQLFQKFIDQQRLDIDSNLAAASSHQEAVGKLSSLYEDKNRETSDKLSSLGERVDLFEKTLESKLESSALSINDRITALERAIETISKGFSSSESELAKLHALFAEFGVSTKSSTQTLQEKLHNELALLSSKIDRQEKAIMNNKAAVSSSTNSGDKGDGPSFFTVFLVVFLAGVTSAGLWYNPELASMVQNLL